MQVNCASYWSVGNSDYGQIIMCLKLLDILKFRNNIAIIFRRLPKDGKVLLLQFSQSHDCKIVHDTMREDRCVMHITSLFSCVELYDIISKLDEQTELLVVPNIKDFSSFLFNSNYIESKNSIRSCISSIQASYDGDYGFHITWDSDSEDLSNMGFMLENWEQMLKSEGYNFKKRIYK